MQYKWKVEFGMLGAKEKNPVLVPESKLQLEYRVQARV
jgi:hypothetical protein